jgi:hypothetical protein
MWLSKITGKSVMKTCMNPRVKSQSEKIFDPMSVMKMREAKTRRTETINKVISVAGENNQTLALVTLSFSMNK